VKLNAGNKIEPHISTFTKNPLLKPNWKRLTKCASGYNSEYAVTPVDEQALGQHTVPERFLTLWFLFVTV